MTFRYGLPQTREQIAEEEIARWQRQLAVYKENNWEGMVKIAQDNIAYHQRTI